MLCAPLSVRVGKTTPRHGPNGFSASDVGKFVLYFTREEYNQIDC